METAADLLKAQAYQSIYRIAPAASVFERAQANGREEHRRTTGDGGRRSRRHHHGARLRRKIILMSRSSKETPVREIMTSR